MIYSASLDTELDADAVEFCPDEEFANVAICGTYKLEESDAGGRADQQTRHGRLLVMNVDTTSKLEPCASMESSLDVSGVFDIKWLALDTHPALWDTVRAAPQEGTVDAARALLGHAAADGFLYTYTLTRATDGTAVWMSVKIIEDTAGQICQLYLRESCLSGWKYACMHVQVRVCRHAFTSALRKNTEYEPHTCTHTTPPH
eukprot:m.168671 g.168671  ORF g.168671 m.168671 type:complete len:202 (-) comp18216_c0_seq3:929-1534(-)